ncbi:MAG: glycosyltransferase family 1 protein [Kiritimatiellae bacterium]|nr:glycosyltransferase family 1 protein [Kiritimatiellia bacterium]
MLNTVKILAGESRYDVWRHWQTALAEAFRERHVRADVIPIADLETSAGEDGLISLGFNLVRAWNPRTEPIHHLAWLVDHPIYHNAFFHSDAVGIRVNKERCVVGSVDRNWLEFARQAYGFAHVHHLPHATVLPRPVPPDWRGRDLDVVFFGSLEDPGALFERVREEAGRLWPMVEAFLRRFACDDSAAAELGLLQLLAGIGCKGLEAVKMVETLFPPLDMYRRFLGRANLLRGIGSAPVHVYGAGPWDGAGLPDNIHLHPPLPYAEVLQTMARAKVLLNHTPTLRSGGHERIFDAIASGCAVVTTGSAFLAAEFGANAAMVRLGNDGAGAEAGIRALLEDPARAAAAVREAQGVVWARHRMANRVDRILGILAERWPGAF